MGGFQNGKGCLRQCQRGGGSWRLLRSWSGEHRLRQVFHRQKLSQSADGSTKTVFIANVTFEPGCRNNWHVHHASKGGGQLLICVDGEGWHQEAGKPAQSLKPGNVVTIPAEVKHWHGAKKGSWFSHLAVEVPGENTSNEWLEPVTDEAYAQLED